MRTFLAIALSSTLLASAAVAADTSPLAAGKPAGVRQAQMNNTTWVLLGIGAVTAIAIGIASSSNGSPVRQNPPLAVTTTTI
ncbi:MAG TPA: hypothetical protein VH189_01440 [Rhizomicrobium sp.]|jgi:hypothetical protein|nr:hypothetical protein [Rhizomicrobium sp.]